MFIGWISEGAAGGDAVSVVKIQAFALVCSLFIDPSRSWPDMPAKAGLSGLNFVATPVENST
jgi:hypothetical protein